MVCGTIYFMKRYTRAELLSVCITIVIFFLPFFVPDLPLGFDANTTLTVVSILFTILVGFFIASATSNYFRLQELISRANAGMASLYGLVCIVAPSKTAQMAEVIDRYMIASLDYDLLHFAAATQDEFHQIIKAVDMIRPDPGCPGMLLQNVHGIKTSLFELHQEMMIAAKTIVGPRHWFVLISLATVIGILALMLREGNVLSALITGVLMMSTYQVLKLLYEIDTNLFLTRRLAFQNPQQVFQVIGRLPYYPKYALDRRNVVQLPAVYRIGIHEPGSKIKRFKIVGHSKKRSKR